jgi:hypothetical protein
MSNSERKRKAAEEHNKQYNANKARISKMSQAEIHKENISNIASKITPEVMRDARGMLNR